MEEKQKKANIKLAIPEEIKKLYNNSLYKVEEGKNTLVGDDSQLYMLDATMYDPLMPSALILGEPGSGKTSLIKQWIFNRSYTQLPVIVVELNLERLGELGSDIVMSRIRTLLSSMKEVEKETQKANPDQKFQMVLFIDEIHKLQNYGAASKGEEGGSGAMNAFKNEMGAGLFPIIGATTEKEYEANIKIDPPFDRRLGHIWMNQPSKKQVVEILKRHLEIIRSSGEFTPMAKKSILVDIVDYSNAYIYNQANPAKALTILGRAIGICAKIHAENPNEGWEITFDTIAQVFKAEGFNITKRNPNDIHLVIPPEINEKYNHSLSKLKKGDNTFVGGKDQREMLDATMYQIDSPTSLILGEQGSGKTALVEQWVYDRYTSDIPILVVQLNLEKLGALDENVMISRMRSLLPDLIEIKKATVDANPRVPFDMVLFIDEIHKLGKYGVTANGEESSGAINALKEGLGRGVFPLIGATTDYEYRQTIVKDLAFERRFSRIIMEQPTLQTTIKILNRRIEVWKTKFDRVPDATTKVLQDIVKFSDAFIMDQVNPAKSLKILDKCTGYARRRMALKHQQHDEITRQDVVKAFLSEGYTVETTTTPEHVNAVVRSQVLGQPLALKMLEDVVNTSLYVERDYKKPLMTAFEVGTTGTGKTQTAKALALAFYGRSDAILSINGGDYATAASAIEAQHYIGDRMSVNKRQVILLDEIEKAHPAVRDAFMTMIDEGIALDSLNNKRSLNSTVIVATSNLGAEIFSNLSETMFLNRQQNPDSLADGLEEAWWRKEGQVREALQNGDVNLNNGIKPEFLERFSLFIPFLPLAKKTIANIARKLLEDFQKSMKNDRYNINIQLPDKLSHEQWSVIMGTDTTPYGNNDPLSVMIAEDLIGAKAKTSGARSIIRYIKGQVQTKVTRVLAQRLKDGLDVSGDFRLVPINASFNDNNRQKPDVRVDYIERIKV